MTRGLASGTVSRGQTLKLVGAGILGALGLTALFPDAAEAKKKGTKYTAGEGLNLTENQFSLADGGVTTAKIADGSVTTAKIANNATEPSRIQSWSDNIGAIIGATGDRQIRSFVNPGITVTVPPEKAYYYLITYSGLFSYKYGERSGSNTGFYGDWDAAPVANDTVLTARGSALVSTGYREDWVAVGSNNYWTQAFHNSWIVRLEEGTRAIKIQIAGYSDNTMDFANLTKQDMQVMRLY